MAREPIAGMVENAVPTQLDQDDLVAEVELELPGSQEMGDEYLGADVDIEILPEDDGGVVVDFEPQDQRGQNDGFYTNLAEEMPDRELEHVASELLGEFDANKASRQGGKMLTPTVWSFLVSPTRRELSRSEALPALRIPCLQRQLHNSKRRRLTSCCRQQARCELLSLEVKLGKSSSSQTA